MKELRDCRARGILALITMLFGALVMIMTLPAYGQQEVSPSWYDPWAPANTAVAQAAKPAVGAHKAAGTVKSASAAPTKSVSRVRRAGKLHAKRSATRPTVS